MIEAMGWLFLAVVWGTTWAAVKIGLETLPPMTFSGIRFALAGALLLGVSWGRGRFWPSRLHWTLIGGTAVLAVALPYGLQFWGQQHIASGLAAVLTATIPVLVMFMAHWALPDEPLTARKLWGAGLGFAGIVWIFSDQVYSVGTLALLGSIALVIGAVSSAWAQVWIKRRSLEMDPLTLAAWQMMLGSVPLLILGAGWEGNWASPGVWPLKTLIALGYLAVFGSAAAFLVLYWLLRRLAVTRVLTVGFANPVVAVLLGWIWLGEVLSPGALIGGVCVLAGLWLILKSPPSPARTALGTGRTTLVTPS